MGIKSPSYKITEGKRYKFGLELETIYGRLPYYLDNYLNLFLKFQRKYLKQFQDNNSKFLFPQLKISLYENL